MSFVASKILWTVLAPGNLLLLLLLAGVVRAVRGKRRRGFGLIIVAALGLLVSAVLPIGSWLAAPLENRFPVVTSPPATVDGIIVLGGAIDGYMSQERGQIALNDAVERVTETLSLARRYPTARVLISGGEGALIPDGTPEADATRDFLVGLGLAPDRILIEGQSRNTYENATMSLAAAQPRPGETWLLVTSAMHMPRAVGCFRRAGWRVIAYPVDYRTPPTIRVRLGLAMAEDLAFINVALKEWIGLIAYYGLGRTDALYPGPVYPGPAS